ncbi:MAG: hypothetical protein IPM92_07895 [Saprospiraceae bacterium]|nr:hypothetical protein [Saprospiraceae bacterium]
MMLSYFNLNILTLVCFVSICSCNRKASNGGNVNGKSQKPAPELPIFKTTFTATDTLVDKVDTILYYQRSACFGFCPTFQYTVYENGIVKYEGLQHVDKLGCQYALATDAWWDEVKKQIAASRFFDLAPVYPVEPELYIPDLPNTIVIVKEFGLYKKVTDNHHAPKPLKDFEIFLESHFQKLEFRNAY